MSGSLKYIICISFFFLFTLPVSAQFWNTVFDENFDNNDQKWPIETSTSLITKIENGRYVIDKTTENGAQLIWNPLVSIKGLDNYDIEANVKHISGDKDYGYGITWGGADALNYYVFSVSGYGSFAVYKFESGHFFDLKENTFLPDIVRETGFWNNLRISKQGNKIHFFVNKKEVFSMDYDGEIGDKSGLVVNKNMTVVVDDYHVQLPQGEFHDESKIELVWLSPLQKLSIAQEQFYKVELGVRSEELLSHVSLYVNHVLVSKNDGFELVRGGDELDEIIVETVKLHEGVNEIKVVIEDTKGHKVEERRMIKYAPLLGNNQRRDFALLIANDEYDHWTNLVNPINDAETIAAELQKYYGFQVEVLRNVSSNEVMAKLKEYAKKYYNNQDQLFIFFAGHGKFDEAFGEGYVVCKNSLKDDVGNTSYLSHSTLRTVINNIPCEHVCMMMDVCFGGTFDPKMASRSLHRGLEEDDVYGELSRKQYIEHKLQYQTRVYVTSGGKEYVPDGRAGYHSPFVRKILEALRMHGGEDKILTFSEIVHFLERVQPEPRWGEFGDNEPGSDFMFIVE